jgi:phospholipase A1
MLRNRTRLLLSPLALLPGIAPVHAQDTGARTAIDACIAIEIDATRLACYDKAAGRQSRNPQQADAVADSARQYRKSVAAPAESDALPKTERARRALSNLFDNDSDPVDLAIANAGKGSLLDSRWELARDSKLGTFNFRAYKPVYLLPAFWSSKPNEMPHSPNPDNTVDTPQALDDIEAKFQISFKTKAFENVFGDNGDVWMAYTQSSRWQVYNGEASRPFRETNYEPEVLLAFRTGYGELGW